MPGVSLRNSNSKCCWYTFYGGHSNQISYLRKDVWVLDGHLAFRDSSLLSCAFYPSFILDLGLACMFAKLHEANYLTRHFYIESGFVDLVRIYSES